MSRWANPLVKGFMAMIKQQKLRGKETVKYIGQDHLGNKYFEADRPNNNYRRISRFFQAPKVENFNDVVEAAHVPPGWEAWLRFRRKDPPTSEEVQESEEYFRYQQQLAAQKKASEESTQPSEDSYTGKAPKEKIIPREQYER